MRESGFSDREIERRRNVRLLVDLIIAMLVVSGVLFCIGWAIAKVMEGRK